LIGGTAAIALAGPAFAQTRSGPSFAFDAMGEVRFEYDDALIRAMQASGITAVTVTLCDPKVYEDEAYRTALEAVRAHDAHFAARPDLFLKATSVADLDRARDSGRIAIFYLFQNTTQFGRDLDRVDRFHDLGVRSAQITYNDQNWAGSGCKEIGANGLTLFGRELIGRMNARRMLIDLSHANMKTMADAIAASRVPVIVSHTGCMAVHANDRNTTDENLRALADRGGVVGICQIRPFLTDRREGALDAYFAHIAHAVKVAGVDHLGIGSDRDHRVIEMTPEYIAELKREQGPNFNDADWPLFIDQLNGPRRMEVIRNGLRTRGMAAADVDKIMGGNVRRIYEEVIG